MANLSTFTVYVSCISRRLLLAGAFFILSNTCEGAPAASCTPAITAAGEAVFNARSLSKDGKVNCATCHDPQHAFTDGKAKAVGVFGKTGTRNTPSLLGIADDPAFFWDGRRSTLADVVLDPFTNPVELGLDSVTELEARIAGDETVRTRLESAFDGGRQKTTLERVRASLVCYVRSLSENAQASATTTSPMTPQAERGKKLFIGLAGCSECHRVENGRYSDSKYHHSGVEQAEITSRLDTLSRIVAESTLSADKLGPQVLADAEWSALGRFVVTHQPIDIGAFLTPSLRNVAATAPYMHDGSIRSLREAVDREIYYRAFSTGRTTNLSQDERDALVAFLETL